jgi:hypothetical protein
VSRAGAAAFVLLLALVFASASPARADDAAYRASLLASAATLEAAEKVQRQGVSVPELHLPPAPLPGPPRFSPSLDDWLQAQLADVRHAKNWRDRIRRLREASKTLRRAALADQAAGAAHPPTQAVDQTIAAVLAQPAYHQQESTAQAQVHKSLWQRFIEWLAGEIDKLFSALANAAAGAPILGKIIVVLLVAALVALVAAVAYRLARYISSVRRKSAAVDDGELLQGRPDPDELYAQARAAAARRRYAAAIAFAFRASLLQLDAKGLIAFDPSRTAGEYRHAVWRARSGAAAPFDDLAHAFTLAAYAEAPTDESDWRDADAAYQRFEPLLGPRVGSSAR